MVIYAHPVPTSLLPNPEEIQLLFLILCLEQCHSTNIQSQASKSAHHSANVICDRARSYLPWLRTTASQILHGFLIFVGTARTSKVIS